MSDSQPVKPNSMNHLRDQKPSKDTPAEPLMSDVTEVEAPPDPLHDEVGEIFRQIDDEALANRTDEEWWLDLTGDDENGDLSAALADLERGGCPRARLLSDLRELDGLNDGYNTFGRDKLPRLIRNVNALAEQLWLLEMSGFIHILPKDRVRPDALEKYAADLGRLRQQLQESPRVWITKRIDRLTRWVNGKIRPRGRVGKVRQHEALALLIGAVLRKTRTPDAQRVATARMKKGKTTKRESKPRRPRGRPGATGWRSDPRTPRKARAKAE